MTKTTPIPSPLAALDSETQWVNSEPLTAAALRGKVVSGPVRHLLVHQLDPDAALRPRLGARLPRPGPGRRRRPDAGVRVRAGRSRVCGGRSPPMGVELPGRPRQRRTRSGSAFENRYWPALYVLDGEGSVRYHHFGEGAYEESETIHPAACSASTSDTLPTWSPSASSSRRTGTALRSRRRTSAPPAASAGARRRPRAGPEPWALVRPMGGRRRVRPCSRPRADRSRTATGRATSTSS